MLSFPGQTVAQAAEFDTLRPSPPHSYMPFCQCILLCLFRSVCGPTVRNTVTLHAFLTFGEHRSCKRSVVHSLTESLSVVRYHARPFEQHSVLHQSVYIIRPATYYVRVAAYYLLVFKRTNAPRALAQDCELYELTEKQKRVPGPSRVPPLAVHCRAFCSACPPSAPQKRLSSSQI